MRNENFRKDLMYGFVWLQNTLFKGTGLNFRSIRPKSCKLLTVGLSLDLSQAVITITLVTVF